MSNEVEQGEIRKLNYDRGFGFISRTPSGADTFFHHSVLVGVLFDDLNEGDPVSFVDGVGNDNRPRATLVRRV